mmetsp:Transcript_35619/g.96610  ORF Transcript_35619/g.96610 Transcript_35619/m.96610 type:complete len:303 (+) Transcript_35619:824-1732(+)
MPAFVAERECARACSTSLIRVALLGSVAISERLPLRGWRAKMAAAATTPAAPDTRKARLRPRRMARRRRQASTVESRHAPAAPREATPRTARAAATPPSSPSSPFSPIRPCNAFLALSPKTTVATRSITCSSEMPGTKDMTTTSEVQRSSTGLGTFTFGKASQRLSCTRRRTLASNLKSSSFVIQSWACVASAFMSGNTVLAINRKVHKSARAPARILGCWTFTTTSEPSDFRRARWTWPMLAAPKGLSSKLLKTSSSGRPKALFSTARTRSMGIEVTSPCIFLNWSMYACGRMPSGMMDKN